VIVEILEDELQWPDVEKRQKLAAVFPGMFSGCISVVDVKEYQAVKYLDTVKERRSWSGKKKINSDKLLSVMDHSGCYIFACICLGKNIELILLIGLKLSFVCSGFLSQPTSCLLATTKLIGVH